MPTGKVKWYDVEKGFGFLSQDEGEDVYVRSAALPKGVEGLKPGQRVEFGMAAGRRGPQALSVKVLDPVPSVRAGERGGRKESAPSLPRKSPEDLQAMIQDMVTLLDGIMDRDLSKGRYPDRKVAQKLGEVMRAVAREFDH
ncbi:cold-shock protein [Nocardia stercoris]|uniref:Cold-shock protein n=1 Tax=Nocardia stercoris TaxID=2483361 RepID=A0A3M2KVN7_9NOCA|nr:cold-shock protein [Nocardia stercoris]RMI29657.1 cold-shock protein [Nocardia stercoris]